MSLRSAASDLRPVGLRLPICAISPLIVSPPKGMSCESIEEEITRRAIESIGELGVAQQPRNLSAFICVSSLPYPTPSIGYSIARRAGLAPARIVELRTNCCSIIDAMLLAAYCNVGNPSDVLITVSDCFGSLIDSTTISQKPNSQTWKSAASSILLTEEASTVFELEGFATTTDLRYQPLSELYNDGGSLRLRFPASAIDREFVEIDLPSELATISAALRKANASLSGTLLVVTNRDSARTDALRDALGTDNDSVVSSRREIGHTGGSDLLYNLQSALHRDGAYQRLVLSANGLGYSWSALVLRRIR